MEQTSQSMNPLIEPKPGDPDRAEDLLDEIQAVLRKRNAALVIQNGRLFVAVPGERSKELRAIAEVRYISPAQIDWRPFDWTAKAKIV
jgi:hypothetical protein